MVKYRVEVYGKNSSRKALDKIIEDPSSDLPREGDLLDLTRYFKYNTDRVRLVVREIKRGDEIPLLKICEESEYVCSHLELRAK